MSRIITVAVIAAVTVTLFAAPAGAAISECERTARDEFRADRDDAKAERKDAKAHWEDAHADWKDADTDWQDAKAESRDAYDNLGRTISGYLVLGGWEPYGDINNVPRVIEAGIRFSEASTKEDAAARKVRKAEAKSRAAEAEFRAAYQTWKTTLGELRAARDAAYAECQA